MKNTKPSERIEDFLNWIEASVAEYEEAYAIAGEEDKKVQDFLHAMEFADIKQERNRVATKLHQSRKRRRAAKDKVLELEKIYAFYKDQSNRPILKKLKGIIQNQKKTEEYLESERTYKPRVSDDT